VLLTTINAFFERAAGYFSTEVPPMLVTCYGNYPIVIFFNAESSGYYCVWFSVAVRVWLTVYVVSTLPSVVFVLYGTVMAFGLFIPITGRIGPDKNPELIIGIFSALLCLLLISYMVSMSRQ
jgi:hypothetical protein